MVSAGKRKKLPTRPKARTVVVQMRLEEDERRGLGDIIEQLTAAADRGEELLERLNDLYARSIGTLAKMQEIKETMIVD